VFGQRPQQADADRLKAESAPFHAVAVRRHNEAAVLAAAAKSAPR